MSHMIHGEYSISTKHEWWADKDTDGISDDSFGFIDDDWGLLLNIDGWD